ncbi:Alpha/Beta hydrolase protein [Xylariales sp. PMI_506]|nr:Alpha/Beta hydrolase protein [Xylariales sp. PMI_506]
MAPRSRAELLSYGLPDRALLAVLAEIERNPVRDPWPSDPYYGRRLREKHHMSYLPGPIPEVREVDRQIEMRDGARITVRIYKPRNPAQDRSPVIVMYHEGGLAPEHLFLTWVNNCRDALKWAAQNAAELGADPTKGFIVGGGSAGGNIAAVLAHVARDEKLNPPLTGQYLCVPAIMVFTPPDCIPERYHSEYLSHSPVTHNRDPLPRPLMVPFLYGEQKDGHGGVPPAYLQVCGLDPLRDETLIYERVLREGEGVRTRLDLYPGLGHYFWTNWPLLDKSKEFVEDTERGVRWLLGHESEA